MYTSRAFQNGIASQNILIFVGTSSVDVKKYRVVGRFVQNRARFCPKTCHAEEVTEPICFKFVQDIVTYISFHPPKTDPHYLQNNRVVNPNVEATLKKQNPLFYSLVNFG